MRLPPLALALAAGALGATAAVATAQDVPPFTPEPTTTTPTVPEPAVAPDPSAPLIRITVPRTFRDGEATAVRIGRAVKTIRISLRDPDSLVRFAQVDVKRRIRLSTGVRDQAWDGRRWWTTTSATKYRIFPEVGGSSQTHTLRFPKGLSKARYWITVKAQNEPGTEGTKRSTFRTR